MEAFKQLSKQEKQLVYTALMMLGDDIDAAYTSLQDEGIYLECDELLEIAEHYHLLS